MEVKLIYDCMDCNYMHSKVFKQSKSSFLCIEPVGHNCWKAYNIYYDSRGREMVDLRLSNWNMGYNLSQALCNSSAIVCISLGV